MKGWRMLAVVIASALVAVPLTSAQFDGLVLTRFTVDGGGGASRGGSRYTLLGTIGQPDGGLMSGEPYSLTGGFWVVTGGSDVLDTKVYLPLVQR